VKSYFNEKGISYTNRDVEIDSEAMDLLVNRYQSSSVPLIVIGNDEIVLRGFEPEQFEKAIHEYGNAR
jgi:glutaredoxin